MSKQTLAWTFGPAGLVTLFFIATSLLAPESLSLDNALLLEQFVLAVILCTIVIWTKRFAHAGWQKKFGFSWLWLAGPLWLAILTPIGLALPVLTAHPAQVGLFAATSLFVGLSEETIFRGFLLNGLRRHMGPLTAAFLSALAFGLLHSLNGLVGADPIFLMAQMFVALGTGLALAAVTLRAGSIWPAVFLHFAGDTVGLSALGGFENATQTPEAAPGMIIGGLIFGIWGAFWIWRLNKRGNLSPVSEIAPFS